MRARSIISRLDSVCAKLKTLEDDIRVLWADFDTLKDGETILGCATKKEFCEKKLHRAPQTVRYMLNPELRTSKQCLPLPTPMASETAENCRKCGKVHLDKDQSGHKENDIRGVRHQSWYRPDELNAQPAETPESEHFNGSESRRGSHRYMAELGRYYLALKRAVIVPTDGGFHIVDSLTTRRISNMTQGVVTPKLVGDLAGNLSEACRKSEGIDVVFVSEAEAGENLVLVREIIFEWVDKYTDQDLATATLHCCKIDFPSLEELQTHRQTIHSQQANGGNFRQLAPSPAKVQDVRTGKTTLRAATKDAKAASTPAQESKPAKPTAVLTLDELFTWAGALEDEDEEGSLPLIMRLRGNFIVNGAPLKQQVRLNFGALLPADAQQLIEFWLRLKKSQAKGGAV
jgi:hypothetical protein